MSLRLRLALFGAAVVALALLLFGLLLYGLLSRGVSTNQDAALKARARAAVVVLNASALASETAPIAPADARTDTGVFLEVFDPGWSVLYTTAAVNGSPPAISPRLESEAATLKGGAFDTENGLRLYAVRFSRGYVVTGQSTQVPRSNLGGVAAFLVISGVSALLAAMIASYLVAGRALRPLKTVALEAGEIGRTRNLTRRLPADGSRDEVALLATSFNQMLDRLEDAYESQRRFVADAAHELRTPLTTIRGNAGLLARGPAIADDVRRAAAEDIAAESARMGRLVDRLLALARADAGLQLQSAPVAFGGLVREVGRQAAKVHADRKLAIEAADAAVAGDDDALRQVLWILLDNGFRHSRSKVQLRTWTEAGWLRLVVADDGPGIPVEERERVFQRFYRTDASRTGGGAGLGLSIARWVVEQHHGRILAGESTLGGAALLVDLPLLSPS